MTRSAEPKSLPAPPRCIGRKTHVDRLREQLLGILPPRIAVLGEPGIGKSTLVKHAIHDPSVKERFGLNRFFVDCEVVGGVEEFWQRVGRAMRMPLGIQNMKDGVLDMLHDRSISLMVLDGFESLQRADKAGARQVLDELAAIEHLALVVAARGRVRPDCNFEWRCVLELLKLSPEDARTTFLAEANQHREDDPDLDEILRMLDGHALSVQLIARVASGVSDLSGVLEGLKHQGFQLDEDTDQRMRICIEMSLTELKPPAMHALYVLALCPDGVARGELASITGALKHQAEDPLERAALASNDHGRLRMLAPIREWLARIHRLSSEQRRQVHGHYIEKACRLGRLIGRRGGDGATAQLRAEIINIESFIRADLAAPDRSITTAAIDAACELVGFIRFSGFGSPDLLGAAADVARSIKDPGREARCREGIGDITLARSDYRRAETSYETARLLYQKESDRHGELMCWLGLGHRARYQSKRDLAMERYEQVHRIVKETGDSIGLAHYHKSIGHLSLARKKAEEAEHHYQQALDLFTEAGDECEAANCRRSLGLVLSTRGEQDKARPLLKEALDVFHRTADLRGEADCLRALGDVARRQEALAEALAYYDQSKRCYDDVKDPRGVGLTYKGRGDVLHALALRNEAARDFMTALDKLKDQQSFQTIGRIHQCLARVTTGDARRTHVKEAIANFERVSLQDSITQIEAEFSLA